MKVKPIYVIVGAAAAAVVYTVYRKADSASKLMVSFESIKNFRLESGKVVCDVVLRFRNPSKTPIRLELVYSDLNLGDNRVAEVNRNFEGSEGLIQGGDETLLALQFKMNPMNLLGSAAIPLLMDILGNKARIMDAVKNVFLRQRVSLNGFIRSEGKRFPLNMVLYTPKNTQQPQPQPAEV